MLVPEFGTVSPVNVPSTNSKQPTLSSVCNLPCCTDALIAVHGDATGPFVDHPLSSVQSSVGDPPAANGKLAASPAERAHHAAKSSMVDSGLRTHLPVRQVKDNREGGGKRMEHRMVTLWAAKVPY
jgi:hypothetical protein